MIGGKLVIGGLLNKLGVSTEIIARGKNSGSMSMISPFTPSEREAWVAFWTRPTTSSSARPPRAGRCRKRSWKAGPRADLQRADGQWPTAWSTASARWTTPSRGEKGRAPEGRHEGRVADPPQGQVVLRAALRRFQRVDRSRFDPAPAWVQAIRQAAFWKQVFSEPRLMLMPAHIELK